MSDNLELKAEELKETEQDYQDLMDIVYPIGAQYLSLENPKNIFTAVKTEWEQIVEGRWIRIE